MMTTQAFIYHQRHRVILLDTSGAYFERRYRQVYTKDLIAHRGTDNQILFQFVNQDQKRVDVTGKEFTCRLISHTGEELVLEKPLISVNEAQGQVKLILTEEELDLIAPGKIGFSIEGTLASTIASEVVTAGSFVTGITYRVITPGTTDFTLVGAADSLAGTEFVATGPGAGDGTVREVISLYEPVYVDDNAGGRGVIDVVDSIMPSFVASEILTIPEGQPGPTYVSSILNTDDTDLHTFQVDMNQFVGSILIEGASDVDNLWYEIQTETIASATDLYMFNISGYHPYLRLTITITSGSIDEIKYR